ncbi:hypothetical protein Q7P37_006948 [Cladosporium fusiforme]
MAPGRHVEVISLSDSDDETAPGAKKARLKASRANNPALRTNRAQNSEPIDLTGDYEPSDRQSRAPPKRSRPDQSPTTDTLIRKLQRKPSALTREIQRSATDSSAISKTDSPVIPPSDHEDELPDDPIAESTSASDVYHSMRRNAISRSITSRDHENERVNYSVMEGTAAADVGNSARRNAISNSPGGTAVSFSPKKRVRETDSDAPDSRDPKKRRRVGAQDENRSTGSSSDLSSGVLTGASKKKSKSLRETEQMRKDIVSQKKVLHLVTNENRDMAETSQENRSEMAEGVRPTSRKLPASKAPSSKSINALEPSRSTLTIEDGAQPTHKHMSSRSQNQTAQTDVPYRGSGTQNDSERANLQETSYQAPTTENIDHIQQAPGAENASAASSPSAQLQGEADEALAQGPEGNSRAPSKPTADDEGTIVGNKLSMDPPQVPESAGAVPDLSGLPLPRHVELIIGKYMQEMRDDTDYFTKARLKRARTSIALQQSRHAGSVAAGQQAASNSVAAEVFARQRKINAAQHSSYTAKPGDGSAKFSSDNYRGNKTSRIHQIAKPTGCKAKVDDQDVPGYAHYVSLKSNILAPNTKTMTVWPYFGEDEPNPNEFEAYYDKDTTQRQRKIRRLLQAQKAEEYVDSALQDLHLTWNDILQFLLDPNPDVGTSVAARSALHNREASCSEDFPRVEGSKRWKAVLKASQDASKADAEKLAKAAIFCDNFQRLTGLPVWHVARRSDEVKKSIDAQEPRSKPVESRTCRICLKFNCTQHGELQEENSDSDSGVETDDAVTTDIIYPLRRNFRKRMCFPTSPPADELEITTSMTKQRKTPIYWEKGNYSKAGECGPFYPCHHPGETCAKAECSCVINKTPCEKSCGCSADCPRKFQGCSCSSARHRKSGDLVCMRDERCACYQMGRECDPDLCGSCGVSDVLDPVHRHDDMRSKCHNASIQRGKPKHTLLGDSGVHGMGLYAGQDIKEHEFIGEYKGEVITRQEADRRGAVYEYQDNSYLFMLNTKQEVDSTLYGNKIRFINHRSMPGANVYPLIRLVNTVHRIGLFAFDNIKTGEELFFDYGPKFPEDLLGGKQNSSSKSAQHPRSTKLVEGFYEVEDEEDEIGNRRALKAPTNSKPRPRSRKTDPIKPKKQKGGARPGAGRKKKNAQPTPTTSAMHDATPTLVDDNRDEGRFELPQDRLTAYNISQDKDQETNGGDDDDDDFNPDAPDDIDADQESSEEQSDEDDFYMRTRHGRGRPRKLEL